jgi:hypothetical protein
MATSLRYTALLGGVPVAHAWSLHAANKKLTAAALQRAAIGGAFPVTGEVLRGDELITTRHFLESYSSANDDLQEGV